MSAPVACRILLCASHSIDVEDLRQALIDAGHTVSRAADVSDRAADWDLLIADLRSVNSPANSTTEQQLKDARGARYVPLLALAADSMTPSRLAGFTLGADAVLAHPFSSAELLAQTNALLRFKQQFDHFSDRASELHVANQRLHLTHQRMNQELELARRIQLSFLPQTLPQIPGVEFAVHYRPCGRVGGDFYDVFRLDEHHVGFYVADAMGHGVPASLLTMFLKRGVRAKDIIQSQYRLVPPNEVLQRLNHDLLEQGMMEDSFITMVYALFNIREGTLHFSRAGHPHPVHVPLGRPAQVLESPGTLLGVFETQFTDRTCRLAPGDKTLFYTDGTDSTKFDDQPAGIESFLACVNSHREKPIAEMVDCLAHDLVRRAEQPDDFTLLGLEVTI